MMTAGDRSPFLFERSRLLLWAVAAVLFAAGLGIRLYDLGDLPLDFHATRQLHSALIARGMYYQDLPSAPQWQRDLAVKQWKIEGLIEPQIMERLSAWTYKLVGSADLRVPRLYAIFFWMVGAVFVFLLARDLIGANGAVAALAFFLFLPYGVLSSRAFQPEPLLIASLAAAFWAMLRWERTRAWKSHKNTGMIWAVIAGLLAGLSIYVKSTAVFFIGAAWLGLLLSGMGFKAAVRSKQVWAMAALTVLPYLIYHIYGFYVLHLLESQFSLRFFPQLWKDPAWYLRWSGQITGVTGFELFLAGVVGLFAVREKSGRAMLAAILAGYFVYGLVFAYYVSTHDYYTEPLIPLMAVGVGAAVDAVLRRLNGPRWLLSAVVLGALAFAVTLKGYESYTTLKRADYRSEQAFWQDLGKTLGRDSAVTGLTQDYGYRLAYWGWLTPTNWMASGDFNLRALAGQEFDVRSLFEEQVKGKDYFLVTDFDELDKQPVLKSLLEKNYKVYKQGSGYIIYDLHEPVQ